MSESTRRGFLIMAGAGAAATAGAVVVASTGSPSAAPADTAAETDTAPPATASGPLVAYVQDVRSGRVSVMVGETEVVVSDPDLVARLARIAAGKKA